MRKVKTKAKKSKYGNTKVKIDGILFDSKKEAKRYYELKALLASGDISDLKLQPSFAIAQSVVLDGTKKRVRKYIADFSYIDCFGEFVVEDVKGYKTELYKLKRHIVKEVHGIEVREI